VSQEILEPQSGAASTATKQTSFNSVDFSRPSRLIALVEMRAIETKLDELIDDTTALAERIDRLSGSLESSSPSDGRALPLARRRETTSAKPETQAVQIGVSLALRLGYLALVPLLLLGWQGYAMRWTADDAFIDFRIVRNLLAGFGPVYNVGERVEAYTSPVWLGMLTLGAALTHQVEQTAVFLALILSLAGAAAGIAASVRLQNRIWVDDRFGESGPLLVPLGALVFAVLPPVWDFATSGLEMSLAVFWLGSSYLLLSRVLLSASPANPDEPTQTIWRQHLGALVIGLGVLIRPDLGIFEVAFLGALVIFRPAASQASRRTGSVLLLASALALPVLYEAFRMGYFAELVPSTAIAKEAGSADWSQGWSYVVDFFGTYFLPVPLVVLGVWWYCGHQLVKFRNDKPALALVLAPTTAAVLTAIYIVRLGGDFMHGRFWIPVVFSLLLPVLVVPLLRFPRLGALPSVAAAGIVVVWSVACAASLRLPYDRIGPNGISDERSYYAAASGKPNPVTAGDFAGEDLAQDGLNLRSKANAPAAPRIVLVDQPENGEQAQLKSLPLRPDMPAEITIVDGRDAIGITGFDAGSRVHIVDRLGLADPLAAHLAAPPSGRPGHLKRLPNEWWIARYVDPAENGRVTASIQAAHQALRCPTIAALLHSVEDPLTPQRFLQNILLSPTLTFFRIDGDAARMASTCGAR
jgi:arabinofuranosyltransferase